ncbi:Bug family tripartite tricarboxylate transporter substrate binding protein [Pseudorhodoplanes sp.]|uniref:Bug family tripartite tricarboxylate transporter substrate binding protein n=1 Tax=Pseudorhodoplanes sp. TaxID=1934341 RepID=UPI003D0E9608
MKTRFGRRAFPLAMLALCMTAGAAFAQDWPAKPITAVVPLGAGSASDIVARVVMDQVSRQVGQPIVVENRPGAGGTIGANLVAKSAADGYTILIYGALNTAHAMHSKLPYDTFKDFVPVIALGQQPLVIVTSPGKGYKTLKDMIAAGKAKPGLLNYSSVGVGSASHFGAERLRTAAGFQAQHLPFKGAAEAVTDVVADRSDFSVQLTATTLPLIKDGKLVPLAVSAHKRIPALPDTPTTVELGLPPESVYPFYTGVFVPANTPSAVVERLHREIAKALEAPAVQTRFAQLGVQPLPGSQAAFTKFFHDDVNATVELAKAANIKPN